jgi:hypothetical protein
MGFLVAWLFGFLQLLEETLVAIVDTLNRVNADVEVAALDDPSRQLSEAM